MKQLYSQQVVASHAKFLSAAKESLVRYSLTKTKQKANRNHTTHDRERPTNKAMRC